MNVKDILIDMPLLREQYEFLITQANLSDDRHNDKLDMMSLYENDMWEGILNLFEVILESEDTLDKSPRNVIE